MKVFVAFSPLPGPLALFLSFLFLILTLLTFLLAPSVSASYLQYLSCPGGSSGCSMRTHCERGSLDGFPSVLKPSLPSGGWRLPFSGSGAGESYIHKELGLDVLAPLPEERGH